jgi:hypothetical protein
MIETERERERDRHIILRSNTKFRKMVTEVKKKRAGDILG